jgi:hypothetical protein
MLEIILLYGLCKMMGNLLREKGRKPLMMQIALVLMWIGGEFLAPFIYGVVQAIRHAGNPPEMGFEVYFVAILGAASGAGLAFLIAALLPPIQEESEADYMRPGQIPRFQPPVDPDNPYASPPTDGNWPSSSR